MTIELPVSTTTSCEINKKVKLYIAVKEADPKQIAMQAIGLVACRIDYVVTYFYI